MKKTILFLLLINTLLPAMAQQTITVHFLYGSVPGKGYKSVEPKKFGGKKGGHVTIQTGDSIIGFQPKGNCHMLAQNKNANGYFKTESLAKWTKDTVAAKYSSVVIPVTNEQYAAIKQLLNNYLEDAPYDYAFLGMRCAAASYDVLEHIGVVKKRSRFGKWTTFFYPQLLRRNLLKLADEKEYAVVKHAGRNTRSWEKE